MCRKDHELLQETILAEINLVRKKIFIVNVYRSPSQNSEQFKVFMGKLQMTVTSLRQENSNCNNNNGGF